MIEVEVLTGDWMYEACAFERVPVRPYPSTSASCRAAKASDCLEIREVVSVTKRVRPVSGKGSFLKLADGRGWVLDFVDGHRVMQKWTPEGETNLSEPSTSSSELAGFLSGADLGPPELGEWSYVVLDPRGMSLRSKPTYDQQMKIDRRVHEGEVVVVNERRAGDGVTFLRLDCPQGWVFDRQPGRAAKDLRVRMMEAQVERGLWHYIVIAESGIALRTRCSFSEDTKCGKGPLKGALLEISQRVRVGDTTFLQIKESGRWIFDSKGGKKVVFGPVQLQVAPEGASASVRAPGGVFLLQSPTNQKWAIGKRRLLQHAKVEVKSSLSTGTEVNCTFSQWTFVRAAGAGFDGWVHTDDLCFEDTSPASSDLRCIGSTPAENSPLKEPIPIQWAPVISESAHVSSPSSRSTPAPPSVSRVFTKRECAEAFNAPLISALR